MPALIVRPDAVRHNLTLLEALCHAAGAGLMPVFKEAPLHPDLTCALLEGSHVSSLGVIAWAGHSLPRAAGLEFHHVYSPAPALMPAACCHDAVYAGSLFSLIELKKASRGRLPALRITLETGDCRDGALPEEIPALCQKALDLGFTVLGISANFACLTASPPTPDAMDTAAHALRSMRRLVPDAAISVGGTDILEYAKHHPLPAGVDEIRCGTGMMLGVYPLSSAPIPGARRDTFRLEAKVLEFRRKQGRLLALLDAGIFHTAMEHASPEIPGLCFAGASSAYSVFDATSCREHMEEGMSLSFSLDYRSLARALSSQALPLLLE